MTTPPPLAAPLAALAAALAPARLWLVELPPRLAASARATAALVGALPAPLPAPSSAAAAAAAGAPWLELLLALALALALLQAARGALEALRTRHLPGPWGAPLVGHVPFLLRAPWLQFARWAARHGAVYKLYVWNKLFVVVSDPALVQEMFQSKSFRKDQWSYAFMGPILGQGLVTSEGERWRAHRAVLSPAFDHKLRAGLCLPRLHHVFTGAAARLSDQVAAVCAGAEAAAAASGGVMKRFEAEGGGSGAAAAAAAACEVDLSAAFRQVTLEVISEIALGFKPAAASVFPLLFESILDELNHRVFAPYRALFPPLELAHRRRLRELNGIVFSTIAERRAARKKLGAGGGGAGGGAGGAAASAALAAADAESSDAAGATTDMLDMLLECSSMPDAQIADELKTQLLAGHETSSMMLTWTTYLLAAHPDKLAAAVAEVDSVLGVEGEGEGEGEGGAAAAGAAGAPPPAPPAPPALEKFKQLRYLEQCMNEAMRLYSPVPVLARECCAGDAELGGRRIPEGTAMLVSIWAMHTSPAIWGADAREFVPERFSRERSAGRHAYAFMPFSQGPRNCIGQHLALNEAKVVLGSLLRRFALRLAPGERAPDTDSYIIPVRPSRPLRVLLAPRRR